jgi:hypothetical protein
VSGDVDRNAVEYGVVGNVVEEVTRRQHVGVHAGVTGRYAEVHPFAVVTPAVGQAHDSKGDVRRDVDGDSHCSGAASHHGEVTVVEASGRRVGVDLESRTVFAFHQDFDVVHPRVQ